MENLKKILTVCADGDSIVNISHTISILKKLQKLKLLPDLPYEYHSINPIEPKKSLQYKRHFNEPFGNKELEQKYSVIIFQHCSSFYPDEKGMIILKQLWKRKHPNESFQLIYKSPFQYENLVDVVANSLEDNGLFLNINNGYISGNIIGDIEMIVDNKEKFNKRFVLLEEKLNVNNMIINNDIPMETPTINTFDIWKKK